MDKQQEKKKTNFYFPRSFCLSIFSIILDNTHCKAFFSNLWNWEAVEFKAKLVNKHY